MAKKKRKKRKSPINRWRRVSQFFFLIAMNPAVELFFFRGVACPAMNCWACPAAAFGCPVGAIGHVIHYGFVPFLAIGMLLVIGAFAGRIVCGWACPFGLIQDLMNKIPSPKFALPKAVAWGKYIFLVGGVLLVPLLFGVKKSPGSDLYFCSYCPAGTLEAAIPVRVFDVTGEVSLEEGMTPPEGAAEAEAEPPPDDLFGDDEPLFGDESTGNPDFMGGGVIDEETLAIGVDPTTLAITEESVFTFLLTDARSWILWGFLALFIMTRRPFCRGMCPIGAVFALLNKFSLFRIKVEKDRCKDCNLCAKTCPVGKQACDGPNDEACVRCFECVDSCRFGATKPAMIKAGSTMDSYWE